MFWCDYDLYHQKNVGSFTQAAAAESVGARFDTSQLANGDGGNVFGTTLPAAEKESLIKYLKTL